MSNYTFLTEEQYFGSDQLEILVDNCETISKR